MAVKINEVYKKPSSSNRATPYLPGKTPSLAPNLLGRGCCRALEKDDNPKITQPPHFCLIA